MQEQRVQASVYKQLIVELSKTEISEQKLVDACVSPPHLGRRLLTCKSLILSSRWYD